MKWNNTRRKIHFYGYLEAVKDFEFYVRDSDGNPVYFVQHHESHSHDGMCPHEHWIDLREANIGSVAKGGNFNQFRQDVRPADWA